MLTKIIHKIQNKNKLSREDLSFLISLEEEGDITSARKAAYDIKKSFYGNKVFIRGLIELSNLCDKNCFYCGIRKSNNNVSRYTLTFEEVIKYITYAFENNYASIVIQAGERTDKDFTDFISKILRESQRITEGKLRITLSLGEQSGEVYKKWFNEGAQRYLLRIESSNHNLYKKIHPVSHKFQNRIKCLETIKNIGYQLGTGVLIGLPGQTSEDLANDILFFKDIGADMIGMGPFVPHKDTPLGRSMLADFNKVNALKLALKMIATTRLFLPDINIAATTALESLTPSGFIQGVLHGANVIMINLTEYKYKKSYLLYDNKLCTGTDVYSFQNSIVESLNNIGEEIAFGLFGDSLHFKNRHN